jgi:hypothetical protein
MKKVTQEKCALTASASTFLKRGTLLPKDSKLRGDIIWFKENLPLAFDALCRYRCEDVDGEFRIIGRRGHAWGYGVHKLGFSVEGKRLIRFVERQTLGWATRTQCGDDEANFCAPWESPADLDRLGAVLRLFTRRQMSENRGRFAGKKGGSEMPQPSISTPLEKGLGVQGPPPEGSAAGECPSAHCTAETELAGVP